MCDGRENDAAIKHRHDQEAHILCCFVLQTGVVIDACLSSCGAALCRGRSRASCLRPSAAGAHALLWLWRSDATDLPSRL